MYASSCSGTFFAGGAVLTCGRDTTTTPQMRSGSGLRKSSHRGGGAAAPLAPPLLPMSLMYQDWESVQALIECFSDQAWGLFKASLEFICHSLQNPGNTVNMDNCLADSFPPTT